MMPIKKRAGKVGKTAPTTTEGAAVAARAGTIAASSGEESMAATLCDYSAAVSTGAGSYASAGGCASLAASLSPGGAALAGKNGIIVLALCREDGSVARLCYARTAGDGEEPNGKTVLKPNTWYRLDRSGNFVEGAQ